MNNSFKNSNTVAILISTAKHAVGYIHPTWDRTTYLSRLAASVGRAGDVSAATELLNLASSSLETDQHPIMVSASLLSMAKGFFSCQRVPEALHVCSEADKLLLSYRDVGASPSESILGMLYAEMGMELTSRNIALRIESRARNIPGEIARFTLGSAFRIYVKLGDLDQAESMLTRDLRPDPGMALMCAAFDLLHEMLTDPPFYCRTNWLDSHIESETVASAVLMLLYARLKDSERAQGLWRRIEERINEETVASKRLEAASIACLALRDVGDERAAFALQERIESWCVEYRVQDMEASTRNHLARVLISFGKFEAGYELCVRNDDPVGDGTCEAIVAQLISDRLVIEAIEFVGTAHLNLRPRLIAQLIVELLSQFVDCRDLDESLIRNLAFLRHGIDPCSKAPVL